MATPKATRTRPFLATGAALASAAAIVAASPALVSAPNLAIAGASSSVKSVTANYELAAVTDITAQGISDAYFFGWGGYVGSGYPTTPDAYYPNVHGVYVSGASGVAYYLIDSVLDTFTSFNLDNYFFEIGWLNGGRANAGYSGAGAVIYVGTNELLGASNPISQLTKTVFYYGSYNTIVGTAVSLIQSLVPTFDIGPLTVGGGILASLYFYGVTPDGTFNYGYPGLSALLAYVSTAVTGLLPTAAATAAPAAAAALVAATDTSGSTEAPAAKTASDAKNGGLGGFKATSDSAAAAADKKTDAPAADAATPAVTDTAAATDTGTTASTDTGAPSDDVKAPADTASSTDTGSSATGTTAKPAKPAKPHGPLSQITSKVKAALGGGKKASSSDGSDSSSKGGSAGSDS